MANKLDKKDEPLPQDLTEGVDDDEWVRNEYTYTQYSRVPL